MKDRIPSIAIVLLFSFLGVQLISIGCTLINFCHEISHLAASEATSHEHNHHHKHHDGHHSSTNEEKSQDSCCVENVSIFLQGIEAIAQQSNDLLLAIPYLFSDYQQYFFIAYSKEDENFLEIRPPPLMYKSGLSKRIVLQSFQL